MLCSPVVLHTELTDVLRSEGFAREYIRNVQKMRKGKGFSPTKIADTLFVYVPDEQKQYLQDHEVKIRQEVQVRSVVYVEAKPENATVFTVERVEVLSDIV